MRWSERIGVAVLMVFLTMLTGTAGAAGDPAGEQVGIRDEIVQALIVALSDSDIDVVNEATQTLTSYGVQATPAVPRLKEVLRGDGKGWELANGTYHHRYNAAKALFTISPDDPDLPDLVQTLLDDKVFVVRGEGAIILAGLGDRALSSTTKLQEILAGIDRKEVKAAAAVALVAIDKDNTRALEFAIEVLQGSDANAQAYAGRAIIMAGERAASLAEVTFDRTWKFNSANIALTRGLVSMGDSITPLLYEKLSTDQAGLAASLLAQIARSSPKVESDLLNILHRVDRGVWGVVAGGIQNGPTYNKNEFELIKIIASEPDLDAFSFALYALARLGAHDTDSLELLRHALSHEDANVRLAALNSIAVYGKKAEELTEDVRAMLDDKKRPVRRTANLTLQNITGEVDLKRFKGLKNYEYGYITKDVRYSLIGLGAPGAQAVSERLSSPKLSNGDALDALLAIRWLAFDQPEFARAVLPYLRHKNKRVRLVAATALQSFAENPLSADVAVR